MKPPEATFVLVSNSLQVQTLYITFSRVPNGIAIPISYNDTVHW